MAKTKKQRREELANEPQRIEIVDILLNIKQDLTKTYNAAMKNLYDTYQKGYKAKHGDYSMEEEVFIAVARFKYMQDGMKDNQIFNRIVKDMNGTRKYDAVETHFHYHMPESKQIVELERLYRGTIFGMNKRSTSGQVLNTRTASGMQKLTAKTLFEQHQNQILNDLKIYKKNKERGAFTRYLARIYGSTAVAWDTLLTRNPILYKAWN